MSSFITGVVIAGWYFSNIGVILLNKYLLSIYKFKFPIFLTLCHMLSCTVLGAAVGASRLLPVQRVRSWEQLGKISMLAGVFCFTVVLGNISLKTIPVSFNQAIGATTPAFTAAFSLVLLGQRESQQTYATLVPIILGIIIASGAEPLFELLGFLAALAATAGRALKSVMQGRMLSDPADRMDSPSLLMYMAPLAVVVLVPLTVWYEPGALSAAIAMGSAETGGAKSAAGTVLGSSSGFWALLLLNSLMAYFVNLTNFLVTKHTSALTLQVLGNAKGIVAVVTSVLIFRNPVTLYTALGYSITVAGVVGYSQAKKRQRAAGLAKSMMAGTPPVVSIEVHAEAEALQPGHIVNGEAETFSKGGRVMAMDGIMASYRPAGTGKDV